VKPSMTHRTPAPQGLASAAKGGKAHPRHGHGALPGPTGAPAPRVAVTFVKMWAGYPGSHPYVDPKTGEDPPGFDNQCAIKLSVALHATGVDLASFKGASVHVPTGKAAIRAEELAAWLKVQHFDGMLGPADITGADWQAKIKDKRGIVAFKDYWARPGEKTPTGDHIDLWNGKSLTSSGLAGLAVSFARFTLGMNSGPGFSDLGKATKITFWEVP
jgi:hypothetical protein